MIYKGLVIGGPWDGRTVEHSGNMLYVPKEGGVVAYRLDGSRAAYQPDLNHRYIFVSRYWLPYSGEVPCITVALDILETCYINRTKAEQ